MTIALTGLCKIVLPATGGGSARTIRLCDGGLIVWGAETYRGTDALYGVIAVIDALSEGIGDDVPALQMEFRPPATAAVADLARPGYQTAPAWFWIAEYDIATSTVIGTPDLMFAGQLDQITLNLRRELRVTVVSAAERLFAAHRGSALNPTIHKATWPGETGEDNASGIGKQIAWGVEAPPAAATSGGFAGRFAA